MRINPGQTIRSIAISLIIFSVSFSVSADSELSREFINHIDRHVVGQANAKHIFRNYFFGKIRRKVEQSHIGPFVFLGPSGTGKSFFARQLSDFLNKDYHRFSDGGIKGAQYGMFPHCGYTGCGPGTFAKIFKSPLPINKLVELTDLDRSSAVINQKFGEIIEVRKIDSGWDREFSDTEFVNSAFVLSGRSFSEYIVTNDFRSDDSDDCSKLDSYVHHPSLFFRENCKLNPADLRSLIYKLVVDRNVFGKKITRQLRLESIVLFHSFTKEEILELTRREVARVIRSYKQHGKAISIHVTNEVIEWLAFRDSLNQTPFFRTARDVKDDVRNHVEYKIVDNYKKLYGLMRKGPVHLAVVMNTSKTEVVFEGDKDWKDDYGKGKEDEKS